MENNQSYNPGSIKDIRPDKYTNFYESKEKILDLDIVSVLTNYSILKIIVISIVRTPPQFILQLSLLNHSNS